MRTWDLGFKNAYGAAFAPNPQKPYPFADVLQLGGSAQDNAIKVKWENGYGNLKGKLAQYLKLPEQLKAIRIEYATDDEYGGIPEGCFYFSKLLTEAKIDHDLLEFQGTHKLI